MRGPKIRHRWLDGLGRAVRARAVAADGAQVLALAGLAPGLYLARLRDAATGQPLGTCKVLVE